MTQEEVRKAILKFGIPAGTTGPKNKKRSKTVCQGCGKPIFSDDPDLLGCVITKRGDGYFWHDKCEKRIEKIRSVER